jgi:hypothetical protein
MSFNQMSQTLSWITRSDVPKTLTANSPTSSLSRRTAIPRSADTGLDELGHEAFVRHPFYRRTGPTPTVDDPARWTTSRKGCPFVRDCWCMACRELSTTLLTRAVPHLVVGISRNGCCRWPGRVRPALC